MVLRLASDAQKDGVRRMIVTELYNGQGFGNQLWCYVTTRVIATDHGHAFGIQSPEKFKGADFMNLDFGQSVIGGNGPEGGPPESLPEGIKFYYNERRINHPDTNVDIRIYDNTLVNIPDGTKIDGVMQDEQYILHHKDEIRGWLKVKDELECYDYSKENICVINFRGGEYVQIKNVFLPKKYWEDAIQHMRKINKNFRFVVITDDVATAKVFFTDFEVYHFSIAKDYSIIKNAHYLILSNSSFGHFPAWLNEDVKCCIAPKYWSQYNTSDGYWGCGYNIITGWQYLDQAGNLQDYETCLRELNEYVKKHQSYYYPKSIEKNFLVISSYKNDISWVPIRTPQYIIFDKNKADIYPPNIDRTKVKKVANVGYNLADYFTYIIDHFDQLPECVIFTKGNVFPRHLSEVQFDRLANSRQFTPLEDFRMHKTYWPVCFIDSDGGFNEINNSWYLNHFPVKYFNDYNDFLRFCFKDPVIPRYVRFAPGACYVAPRENILRLPKVFYENLRTFVSHDTLVGEAHIIERALYTLWTANFEINEQMLKPIDNNFVVLPKQQPSLIKKVSRLTTNYYQKLVRLIRR